MWFHRAAGAGTAVTAGLLTGSVSAFFVGAMAAGAVLSLIKQQEPRITRAVRGGSSTEEMTIEELIAEKERLEDRIAEAAAKHAGT